MLIPSLLLWGAAWAGALLFPQTRAAVRTVPLQIQPSASMTRHPQGFNMYGAAAVEYGGNHDLYVATGRQNTYYYYCCNTYYSANTRLEIMRMNTTALKEMGGDEGFAAIFQEDGCEGHRRDFARQENLCSSAFPQNNYNVRYYWRSVRVPPRTTLRMDTYSCAGNTNRYIDVANDHENRTLCVNRYSKTNQYVHNMKLIPMDPHAERLEDQIYLNRAIISNPFYDSVLGIHSQGRRVATRTQTMRVTADAVYVTTFNVCRCTTFPSALLKLSRNLELLGLVEFDNIATGLSPLDNTRYPVDMMVRDGQIAVVFSHMVKAPVALYNATDLRLISYAVFEKFQEEIVTDDDSDQQQQQQQQKPEVKYISSFTRALWISERSMWLFTNDGKILLFDPVEAFSTATLHRNASYTLVTFEEGEVTSAEHRDGKVYVLIGSRLFILDEGTARVAPFNQECGMRAKEFTADWGLTGPFLQHEYTGFGYLFPSGSIQHVALRDMSISQGDGVDIPAERASFFWRYSHAHAYHVNDANVSAIATEDNLLVTATNLNNMMFHPPLLLITHLEGCARGRAGRRCTPCSIGKYADHDGMDACMDCSPGRYSDSPNAVECRACPLGYFADARNSTGCRACSFGRFADAEASTGCQPCPMDSFHMQSGSTTRQDCLACAAGEVTVGVGASRCVSCDDGTYKSPITGNCSLCPRGFFRGATSDIACEACPEGRFAERPGMDECVDCPPGSHTETFMREGCLLCPKGRYGVAPHGESHKACRACAVGFYGPATGASDATWCEACPAGKEAANDVPGAASLSACRMCPRGKYGTGSDARCTLCEEGSVSLEKGAVGDHNCTQCPRGFFWTSSSEPCRSCPKNTFQERMGATGPTSCTPCPDGTLTTGAENEHGSDCVPCPPGKYATSFKTTAAADSRECVPCAAGRYLEYDGAHDASSCVACGVGFYSPTVGAWSAAHCLACPPGKEFVGSSGGGSITEGGSTSADDCQSCAAGRYGAGADAVCEACPTGKIVLREGADAAEDCVICPVGHVWVGGAKPCAACPANSYQPFEGAVGTEACLSCPDGTVAPKQGNALLDDCAPCGRGTYAEGVACTPCAAGLYSDVERATDPSTCEACPVGRYGSPEGSASEEQCSLCDAGRFGKKDAERRLFQEEACGLCDPGFVSAEGATGCSPCPAGSMEDDGGTRCVLCGPGRYAGSEGSAECAECGENRVAPLEGSMLCEACNSNMEPNAEGTVCVCSVNFYDSGDGECVPCPKGATCPTVGTTVETIVMDAGFWREREDSLDLRLCNEAHACRGGTLRNSSDELCRVGHMGPLCHVCAPGFAKTKGLCAPCPEDQRGVNIFVTALAPLVMGGILFMLIRTANPEAGQQDTFSGVSKIAASFAQVYSVCSNFNVKWPPIVQNMFSTTDYINPTIGFYSAECSIGWSYYQKLWIYLLMPPLYVFVTLSILKGLSQKYGGWEFIRRWASTSVVVGLFLAYPSVTKTFMRHLSCDAIGDRFYLSTQYSIECYTPEHLTYSYLAVAALLVYGVGIPLGAFLVLYVYRNRLYEKQPQRLRFLFHGYRLYYWELIVLARKVCILAMSVFLFRRNSVRYQTVVASWAIQASMFIHLKMHPFDKHTAYGRLCDRLEWMGLIACTATLNSGIVFGTTQDDYELGFAENCILVLVMVVNVSVFTVFSYHLFVSGLKKFFLKAGKICGCVPKDRPSPRTLSRRRKSILGKFIYGSEESEFETELATKRSQTRIQIDDTLREQRQRGSSVAELERINMIIAEHYKNQTFSAHKYGQVVSDLKSYVEEHAMEDPHIVELYDLFLSEQTKHAQEICGALQHDRDDVLYTFTVDHIVGEVVRELVESVAATTTMDD